MGEAPGGEVGVEEMPDDEGGVAGHGARVNHEPANGHEIMVWYDFNLLFWLVKMV